MARGAWDKKKAVRVAAAGARGGEEFRLTLSISNSDAAQRTQDQLLLMSINFIAVKQCTTRFALVWGSSGTCSL